MSETTKTHSDSDSLAGFVVHLKQSKLLAAEQVATIGDAPNAIVAAQQLIEAGLLTRWQAAEIQAGQTSFELGNFRLLAKLGEGGMGAVYKAEQQGGIGRVVAIKVMSQKVLNHPDAVQRFLREVRAAAALNHPNIVTAYDADSANGSYFLVMEFVEGRDLSDWIKEFGRLPIDWSCECIRQAALGLEHAHQRSLIHRDIKPSNLLAIAADTGAKPLVKIMDFGLARFSGDDAEHTELTSTGQVMGTIDYIAPEQARNTKEATIRSDIFSLGCTLFKMLTGESAYTGQTITEKLIARTSDDARRVQTLRADVSDELDEVIAKMLARRPEDRFQTPREVVDALLPFCPARDYDSSVAANGDSTDAALGQFIGQLSSQADDLDPATTTLAYQQEGSAQAELPVPPAKRSHVAVIGLSLAGLVGLAAILFVFWPSRAPMHSVWIRGNVPSATVIVDGDDIYQTPTLRKPFQVQLSAGSHDVVIEKQGFKSHRQTINVNDEESVFEFELVLAEGPPIAIANTVPPSVRRPGSPASASEARSLQASWAKQLGKPVTWKNSLGMQFALIPPGQFEMGEDGDTHRVKLIEPFYLGIHEVTQEQYERVIGTNPAQIKNANFPVNLVNWYEAVAFCNALSKREELEPYYLLDTGNPDKVTIAGGNGYQLPTESQWEFACRAGSTSTWYFGDDESQLGDHAWYKVNNGGEKHPVGEKLANPFGLKDLYGSVLEWCFDWSGAYPEAAVVDPTGPARGGTRTVRCGGIDHDATLCRSAFRNRFPPGDTRRDLGFRVAAGASQAPTAIDSPGAF